MRIALVVLAIALSALGPAIPAAGAACLQGDVDADGLCDEDDPCRNADSHALREPRLAVSRRLGRAGAATVRFSGIVPLFDDAPADPATSGLRLIVREGDAGQVVLDLALAPGASWVAGRAGEWIHHDPIVVAGVRRARVREIAPLPAYQAVRAYAVSVDARLTGTPPVSDAVSHEVTVLFAADTPTSRCADQTFRPQAIDPGQPWQLWDGRCQTSTDGASLRCRSGRLRWPCRVSRAEDEMRCLLADIARGQESYRAANGTYCSFDCGLLSIPRPPLVTFLSLGTSQTFEAIAAHAAAPGRTCSWKSAETPHLTCGPMS
jgi:hypothetical protein